jgi:UDP-N-acetylglucosamine pyrophosphorylase
MQLNNAKNGLSIGSRGSGAVLNALLKYKVFKTWKDQNIQYVNICDSSNINNTLADPFNLTFMIKNNLECTLEVTQQTEMNIRHPTILQNKNGLIDCYYPFEMSTVNS